MQMAQGILGGSEAWRPFAVSTRAAAKFVRLGAQYFQDIAPLRHAFGLASDRDETVSSGVSHLLNSGRPMAVIFFVIAVYVFAINGVLRGRLLAHVREKCFEAVAPRVADCDAASPVMRIFFIVRIVAAQFEFGPSLILWRACSVMRSVIGVAGCDAATILHGQAAATSRGFYEVCSSDDGLTTATALATPHRVMCAMHLDAFDDGKSSEGFSGDIQSGHRHLPNNQDACNIWECGGCL